MQKRKVWLNTKWVGSISGHSYEDLAHSPLGDNGDVYLAVEAARNAYPVNFLTSCLMSVTDRQ